LGRFPFRTAKQYRSNLIHQSHKFIPARTITEVAQCKPSAVYDPVSIQVFVGIPKSDECFTDRTRQLATPMIWHVARLRSREKFEPIIWIPSEVPMGFIS
jgi:hypothetical protein